MQVLLSNFKWLELWGNWSTSYKFIRAQKREDKLNPLYSCLHSYSSLTFSWMKEEAGMPLFCWKETSGETSVCKRKSLDRPEQPPGASVCTTCSMCCMLCLSFPCGSCFLFLHKQQLSSLSRRGKNIAWQYYSITNQDIPQRFVETTALFKTTL